jgi:hypothetical protein
LLVELANRGVNEVLVEAGPRLAGAFAQQGLVDEFPNNPVFTPKWIEQAAKEMSSQASHAVSSPNVAAEPQTKASVELEIKKLELEKLKREVNPPETRPPEEDYKISLNPDEERHVSSD